MTDFALKIINPSGTPPTVISNPEGIGSLNGIDAKTIISTAISVLILFAIVATLIYLVWGGIDLILAQGEKQNVQKARDKLTFAVIGLVVVLASFLIVSYVTSIAGVDLFGTNFQGGGGGSSHLQ